MGKRPTDEIKKRQIKQKALEGKSNQEIAAEVGVHRNTVSRVLNSTEMKAMIDSIDSKLAAGVEDAIQTVLSAVKNDTKAAIDLLRNFGSMKQKLDHAHSFPAPLVIEKRDGGQVILGTTHDIDETEEGE